MWKILKIKKKINVKGGEARIRKSSLVKPEFRTV